MNKEDKQREYKKWANEHLWAATFSPRGDLTGWLAFMAVLVMIPVMIFIGMGNETPEEKELHAYVREMATHTPSIRKASGKVSFIEIVGGSSEMRGYYKGGNIDTSVRCITLKGSKTPYCLPHYMNWTLSIEALKAAKTVTIEYDDREHYRFTRGVDWVKKTDKQGHAHTVPDVFYYKAVGITVDGKPYLTYETYKFLDHDIIWFAVPMLLFALFCGSLYFTVPLVMILFVRIRDRLN